MPTAATFSQVLGRVIALRRQQVSLNQAQMAASLGLSQSAYSRLERGSTPFSTVQLQKAARCLGVQPSDLLRHAEASVQRLAAQGVRILDEAPAAQDQNEALLWVALGVVAAAVAIAAAVASESK